MIKLYQLTDTKKEYWEAWENGDGTFTVHSGHLGTRGSETIVSSFVVEQGINEKKQEGFVELDVDDHSMLLIEYPVDGMGGEADLAKRHALEDRMDQTLGWTGLGHCDGGSIGSGTMEVCCFVVDFDLGKSVIERDLADTEFADYSRIHDEDV